MFINEAAVNHTDSENRHMKTGQIEFEWGKYKGRLDSKLYYSLSGRKLGTIQKNGDPFTYDPAGDGKVKVISGPYDSIDAADKSLGAIISDQPSDAGATESDEEFMDFGTATITVPSPGGEDEQSVKALTPVDIPTTKIMDRIKDLTVEEFWSAGFSEIGKHAGAIGSPSHDLAGSIWTRFEKHPDIDGWSAENWQSYLAQTLGTGAIAPPIRAMAFPIPADIDPMVMKISDLEKNNPWKWWDPRHNRRLAEMIRAVDKKGKTRGIPNKKIVKDFWPWPTDPFTAEFNTKWWDENLSSIGLILGLDSLEQWLTTGYFTGADGERLGTGDIAYAKEITVEALGGTTVFGGLISADG